MEIIAQYCGIVYVPEVLRKTQHSLTFPPMIGGGSTPWEHTNLK